MFDIHGLEEGDPVSVQTLQREMPRPQLGAVLGPGADDLEHAVGAELAQANGQLLDIFASPDGSTWTALTTSPAGLACVVASGKGWQQAPTGEPT